MTICPSQPDPSAPAKFPIVGIGASATDLAALKLFLSHLPADSGMAVIVLVPDERRQASLLEQALQAATALPVLHAAQGAPIEPDQVYLSTTGMALVRQAGRLHFTVAAGAPPINHLLASLASHAKELAVGVLLSGTGGDGAEGLLAICTANGITAAQEAAEATPPPHLDPAWLDLVGRPESLPGKIMARLPAPYGRSPLHPCPAEPSQEELASIVAVLHAHTGHDFSAYKTNTLQRRIERRMGFCQILHPGQYLRLLESSEVEARALLKELLIGVTRFFRDAEAWHHLRTRILPSMLQAQASGAMLRAWIPACATGEEAYSLAMIFCEAARELGMEARCSLQIFATDLDQRAIARARRGLYPHSIAADVSPERLERFFIREERGYRVGKTIREMVVFAPHNLLADPPFSRLDLVSCRNVLIYLAPQVHETLFSRFHYSMNPGAHLLLGSAESIGGASRLFASVDGPFQLYRRLEAARPRHHLELPARIALPVPAAPLALNHQLMKPDTATNLQLLSEQFLLRRAPTAVLTNESGDILHVRGNTELYLALNEGRANWNILTMARPGLRDALSEAFHDALRQQACSSCLASMEESDAPVRSVEISVQPVSEPAALRGMMVVFTGLSAPLPIHPADSQALSAQRSTRIKALEDALRRCREDLQATREEMQTSREELTSTNEELQSTNEELTTSAEELRTMNEELLRAHAAVEQGLERYIDLFDSAPVGYFMLERSGAIAQANLAGSLMLETERERLTGTRFGMFVTEADRSRLFDALEAAFQTNEGQRCEVGLWRASGKPRQVSISALVMDDGKACRVVATDITALRETEEALRISEASLSAAQTNAKIGSWELDFLSGKARCSAELMRMYQFGEEQPPPFDEFLTRVHPDDVQQFKRAHEEGMRKRKPYRVEFRVRMLDGQYRWIEGNSRPVFDAADNMVGMAGTSQDITERKEAQEALRASEERFRVLWEATTDAVILLDRNSTIQYANPALLEIFGYAPWDVTGQNIAVLQPEHLRAGHLRGMQRFLHAGGKLLGGRALQTWGLHRDGYEFPIEIAFSHVTIKGEELFAGFIRDCSERHRAELALQSSEQRFRTMFEDAPLGIALIDSASGALDEVNGTFARIAGRDLAQMKHVDWMSITHPDDRPAELANMARLNAREIRSYKMAKRLIRPDGSLVWIDMSVRPMAGGNDAVTRHLCMIEDITARRHAEEELRLAAMVYQHSSEAMMVSDADNNIVAINPAFTQLTGYSAEDVLGKNPSILSSGRHDHGFYRAMWESLKASGRWQGELWNRRKDGEVFAESLTINTIYGPDGGVLQYLALFSDITEKKQSDALIWQQANFDSLTSLPNRRMFRDRLDQDLKKCKREGLALAILFIDLDRFKEINDTLGHDKGDILLIEAARRIRECVRESDTVARMGGDEFTVTLSELDDLGRVERIAQNILSALIAPFDLEPDQAFVSASIGITLYPSDATELEDLLKNADQAMYVAKDAGRNRFSYFTPALQMAALTRMRLTNDLRGALSGGQFRLYFQPIVHLESGQVHKAEALIRWQHPQRGLVSPVEFIGLAESSGLINDIGEWVFYESARWLKRWRVGVNSEFQVSVNQSPLEFQREGAAFNRRLDYMQMLGLPGQAIVVEITEGLLLDATTACTDKLLQCRDAGIQVALDDFGTGYSSLSYLKKFDIDYLKIDQSFTRNLALGSSDMALSEAIIVMAHKLGLKVIAEGVETREQCRLLQAAGCDYGQGYLFAKPMPAEEFDALLRGGVPFA